MQVQFLKEWQGSKVGEIVEFLPFISDDLIARKIAEPYVDESKKDAQIKKLQAEIDELKSKQIDAAPLDKRLKGAARKK